MWVWIGFALHSFRHWLLEPILIGWLDVGSERFYAVYDAIVPLYLLIAYKVIGPKQNTAVRRITIDVMLAFLWADFGDRCIGIVTLQQRDLLLIPFIILVVYKHTYYQSHLSWLTRNSTRLLRKYLE